MFDMYHYEVRLLGDLEKWLSTAFVALWCIGRFGLGQPEQHLLNLALCCLDGRAAAIVFAGVEHVFSIPHNSKDRG